MKSFLLASLLLVCACSGDETSPWQPTGDVGGSGGSSQGGSSQGGSSQGGSSQGGSSQGGSAQGGSSQGGSSQGGSSQGGSSQGGSAGASGAPHVPMCVMGCSSPADCALPNSYPASEWACESGGCVYKGCTSDSICKQVFQNQAYVCRPSFGMNMCVKGCTAASDCASDQGAFSSDNYQCKTDYCDYTGCTSDSECATTMQSSSYRCAWIAAFGYKMCQQGCTTQADCGVANSAAYSSSHYACEQNLCVYKGCVGDAECKQTFLKDSYVCK